MLSEKLINLKKENSSGQAALDFLISWGWIIAVVTIAIIVLFELGLFSPPSTPMIISGFSGVQVSQASANGSVLVLQVNNDYGGSVTITEITAIINGKNYTTTECQSDLLSQGEKSLCRIPVQISSNSYNLELSLKYSTFNSNEILTSNGTISGKTLRGRVPLNEQRVFFSEKNLPQGTTWSVTVGSLQNQTTVPVTGQGLLSVLIPFGTYNYTVGTPSISGCVGIHGSPSNGFVTTGSTIAVIFSASGSCTTTFSESGVPSGYTWAVTYKNETSSASAGNSISFSNPLSAESYPANTSVQNLACNSSAPEVGSGESVSFKSWNCITSFAESGVPLSSHSWTVNFNGASPSVSSSSTTIVQNLSNIQTSTASVSVNGLSCQNVNPPSVYPGSSTSFSSWSCTTTFTQSGVPTSTFSWNATFNGLSSKSTSTSTSITQQVSTITTHSATSNINGLSCTNANSNSIFSGGSASFTSWNCITSFAESGVPLSSYSWKVNFNGASPTFTSSSSTITQTLSGPTQSSASAAVNNLNCNGASTPTIWTGQSTSFTSWACTTKISESGVPTSSYSWTASFDGNSPSTSSSSVSISQTVSTINSYSTSASVNGLSCSSSNTPSIYQGGSTTFNSWYCTTKFYSGISSGYSFFVYYNGGTTGSLSSVSSPVDSPQITTTISSHPYEGYASPSSGSSLTGTSYISSYLTPGNGLPNEGQPCLSGTGNVIQGGSVTLGSWNCVNTLFFTTGSPLPSNNYYEYSGMHDCSDYLTVTTPTFDPLTNAYDYGWCTGSLCTGSNNTVNWQNDRVTLPNGASGIVSGICLSPPTPNGGLVWDACGDKQANLCGSTIYGTCNDAGAFSQYVWNFSSVAYGYFSSVTENPDGINMSGSNIKFFQGTLYSGAGPIITYSVTTRGCV